MQLLDPKVKAIYVSWFFIRLPFRPWRSWWTVGSWSGGEEDGSL